MAFDHAYWQDRLDSLRATHGVPGASLAVLCDGQVHEFASGVLNRGTGVEVTTDSVFLSGSLAKVYTATVVLRLADDGAFSLDTPIAELVPEFGTPDPVATKTITVRQLLSHTGGLTCDFTYDSGRGDDCITRYVQAAADVAADCPPGTAVSYSSVGYTVLGRLIEIVTGKTWDAALADYLFGPLGLTRSMTLPEEALRFRVAMGHDGDEPAAVWDMLPRSAGPYGRVIVSAGDVARFAQMHLAGGVAPDGTRVLSGEAVAAMQRRQADTVDKWSFHADGWGLGWALYDWDGVAGFGHDGSVVTQHSYLRVVPSAGVAVALLVNGGEHTRLYDELFGELLGELAGVRLPAPFGAASGEVPAVDVEPLLGEYRREGVRNTVRRDADGTVRLGYELVDGMAGFADPIEVGLVPVSVDGGTAVFATAGAAFGPDPMPVVFAELGDGEPYLFIGMRATPKIG